MHSDSWVTVEQDTTGQIIPGNLTCRVRAMLKDSGKQWSLMKAGDMGFPRVQSLRTSQYGDGLGCVLKPGCDVQVQGLRYKKVPGSRSGELRYTAVIV